MFSVFLLGMDKQQYGEWRLNITLTRDDVWSGAESSQMSCDINTSGKGVQTDLSKHQEQ